MGRDFQRESIIDEIENVESNGDETVYTAKSFKIVRKLFTYTYKGKVGFSAFIGIEKSAKGLSYQTSDGKELTFAHADDDLSSLRMSFSNGKDESGGITVEKDFSVHDDRAGIIIRHYMQFNSRLRDKEAELINAEAAKKAALERERVAREEQAKLDSMKSSLDALDSL